MAKEDQSDESHLSDIPHARKEPRPDFSQPLPRQTLPKELAEKLEREDSDAWSSVYEGVAPETTDTNIRYAGYAARVKTVLLSAHRYVAYTSDIGESFRPVAHPYLVKGAYGVSWAYLLGDVGHEGYKAWVRNQRVLHPENYAHEQSEASTDSVSELTGKVKGAVEAVKTQIGGATPMDSSAALVPGKVVPIEDYRAVMVQRAVFQSVASMGLPAFTVHSIVKYSGKAMKDIKNVRIRTWGPIGLGLAAVPALPFMFDEPVERATEWIFHRGFQFFGGPAAVGHSPETGRQEIGQQKSISSALSDKEL
ncbi:Mitochondrial fission process protein 1 [Sphaceloma murrayae]|uniref:Mitochondrial fission process protein 1 n=1 Tax=Sphaceloma murrayae TaxID=2082308 RepID=A0A2K1R355_9PEZI|nr:Mitochondrial fission process protein 1 [Sphaceloma murrayae]